MLKSFENVPQINTAFGVSSGHLSLQRLGTDSQRDFTFFSWKKTTTFKCYTIDFPPLSPPTLKPNFISFLTGHSDPEVV